MTSPRVRVRRRDRPAAQQRGRGFMLLVGFAGLGVASLLAYVGFNAPNTIPGRGYYNLTAQLNQADNLTGHYQVRVAGRLVGQVLDPRVEDGQAVVDLQLDRDVGPLLSDTTIKVRPRSPIGVRFVELHPGTRGTPLKDGAVLPASQASASVPLDDVLSTLDPKTRKRTQELLAGLGGGFADRGEDVNETLKEPNTAPLLGSEKCATCGWRPRLSGRSSSLIEIERRGGG